LNQEDQRDFYDDIKSALVGNISCALNVANGVVSGKARHMTKKDFASESNLATGTITSVFSESPAAKIPSLETICKVAYTLNISPAFLLMTPRDWGMLLQAYGILNMLSEQKGEKEASLMAILEGLVDKPFPKEAATVGLEFMQKLNGDDYASEERSRQQKGILVMTALARAAMKQQKRKGGLNTTKQAIALGAFLGDRDFSQSTNQYFFTTESKNE
jgi:transcriptional regulator with XRE-family HTH domain